MKLLITAALYVFSTAIIGYTIYTKCRKDDNFVDLENGEKTEEEEGEEEVQVTNPFYNLGVNKPKHVNIEIIQQPTHNVVIELVKSNQNNVSPVSIVKEKSVEDTIDVEIDDINAKKEFREFCDIVVDKILTRSVEGIKQNIKDKLLKRDAFDVWVKYVNNHKKNVIEKKQTQKQTKKRNKKQPTKNKRPVKNELPVLTEAEIFDDTDFKVVSDVVNGDEDKDDDNGSSYISYFIPNYFKS